MSNLTYGWQRRVLSFSGLEDGKSRFESSFFRCDILLGNMVKSDDGGVNSARLISAIGDPSEETVAAVIFRGFR